MCVRVAPIPNEDDVDLEEKVFVCLCCDETKKEMLVVLRTSSVPLSSLLRIYLFINCLHERIIRIDVWVHSLPQGKCGGISDVRRLHCLCATKLISSRTTMSGNNVRLPTADSIIAIPDGPGSLLYSSVNLSING